MPNRESKSGSEKKAAQKAQNRKIDEESEESFPASDPPAFMGGKHIVGAPRRPLTPEPVGTKPKK